MDIRISPDHLRTVASSLEGRRRHIEDVLVRMQAEVNGLENEWAGMARADYAIRFNERVPQMQNQIDDVLEGLILDLRRIADEFEEVDRTAALSSLGPSGIAGVVVAAAKRAVDAVRDAVEGQGVPPGDEPLVYDGPGTREPQHDAGGCVRHASQRIGVNLRGNAMDIPGNYPDNQVEIPPDAMESDLRQSGIQPGMLMVWQPGEEMYTNVNSNGDFYAVQAAGPGSKFPYGHVAVVEEVGVDYVVISDNHGSAWRIDREPVTYWGIDNQRHTDGLLDNATFLDMT